MTNTAVNELIEDLRIELGDSIKPFFWTEPDLLRYINSGHIEVTRDVPIRDSKTPEITQIAYRAADSEIEYHPKILRVLTIVREDSTTAKNLHRVVMKTQENALSLFSVRRSDYGVNVDATRELNRASDLFDVYVDYDENFLRFSSPAETAGTLLLQVDRLADKKITDCDQILETRPEHDTAIVAWAAYRAWLKQDAETFDEKASERQLALFNGYMGRGKITQKRRNSQPGIVKYGGI